MISIIPELEILNAVTDNNMSGSAAQARVSAFNEATELLSFDDSIELVIEGRLYSKIYDRLIDSHKIVFEELYDIDDSAKDVTSYDITKAIKFIIDERKLPILKKRVIVITNNPQNYDKYSSQERVVILKPTDFLSKVEKFKQLRDKYNSILDAIITAFFI